MVSHARGWQMSRTCFPELHPPRTAGPLAPFTSCASRQDTGEAVHQSHSRSVGGKARQVHACAEH